MHPQAKLCHGGRPRHGRLELGDAFAKPFQACAQLPVGLLELSGAAERGCCGVLTLRAPEPSEAAAAAGPLPGIRPRRPVRCTGGSPPGLGPAAPAAALPQRVEGNERRAGQVKVGGEVGPARGRRDEEEGRHCSLCCGELPAGRHARGAGHAPLIEKLLPDGLSRPLRDGQKCGDTGVLQAPEVVGYAKATCSAVRLEDLADKLNKLIDGLLLDRRVPSRDPELKSWPFSQP
mmetsp:Transcript_102034/g.304459  ORF Transcript_102034/g.304459 Transcript_102034/m.304459 type:complete len:233 (-) Transcript_102034:216-914(-)